MIKANQKKRNLSDETFHKKARFVSPSVKCDYTLTCKTGHLKSVLILFDQILGEGAFKKCIKAQLIGGKQVNKKKIKAFLQELKPDYFGSGKQLLVNLHFSNLLRNEAEKYGRKDLFMKMSPVVKKNSDTIVGIIEKMARNTLLLEIYTTLPFQKIHYIKSLLLAGEIMEKAGVFHRDLKPENILIVNGDVCIGDFDFATKEVKQSTVQGTPGYLPPELLSHPQGAEFDLNLIKQDPYAMGMIILQLLLNKPLINAATPFTKDQLPLHLKELECVWADSPHLVKITNGLLNFNALERLTLVQANKILTAK